MKPEVEFFEVRNWKDAENFKAQVRELEPEMILCFPTYCFGRENIEKFLKDIKHMFPSLSVFGCSISAYSMRGEDFETKGIFLLLVKNVKITQRVFFDVWSGNGEGEMEKFFVPSRKNFQILILSPTARQPKKESIFWKWVASTANRLIEIKSDRISRKICKMAINSALKNRTGYPPFLLNLRENRFLLSQNPFKFGSVDEGRFENGFEIMEENVFESSLFLAVKASARFFKWLYSFPALRKLEEKVIEKFDRLKFYRNICYLFNGKTVFEIGREHAFHIGRVEHSGFTYWFVHMFEKNGKKLYIILPFPNYNTIYSCKNFHENDELWLIRAPSGKEILESCFSLLEGRGERKKILHFHVSNLIYFSSALFGIVKVIRKNYGNFPILIGDWSPIWGAYTYPVLLEF